MNDQSILPGGLVEDKCIICKEGLADDGQKMYQKGLETLIRVSRLRQEREFCDYLVEKSKTLSVTNVYVHKHCRIEYCDMRRSDRRNDEAYPQAKRLRSNTEPFDWRNDCFICGKNAAFDEKHPNRCKVVLVTSPELKDKLLKQCAKRDDSLAHDVLLRVDSTLDLVAMKARYHAKCYTQYFSLSDHKVASGRPKDFDKQKWFVALCQWLDEEGENEKMTVSDLHRKMVELANGEEVYSIKSLREKLHEYYGDYVFWTQAKGGRESVLCFQNMASYIIHQQWETEKEHTDRTDAERIVLACVRLLKTEIQDHEFDKNFYPSTDDISDIEKGRQFLTPLMRLFIEKLIKCDTKCNSIGQALTQAVRPSSVISPILFGLGVEMDHIFGSRWLIDELHKLGFSVSYDEVKLFKHSILQVEDLYSLTPPQNAEITQWASDNADHLVATLDGGNQFHGMGTIVMSFVKEKDSETIRQRVKRKARLSVTDLVKNKGVNIVQYVGPQVPSLCSVKFKSILELKRPYIIPTATHYSNLLWQSSRTICKEGIMPHYFGFMQHFFKSFDSGNEKWQMLILPFIDLNPNDETCLYSTLLYIDNQSKKLQQPSASVTFDQPLWQKAVEITSSKNLRRIVCRLGGFHLLMSACGSIGNIMKGSGLEEAIEQVYGPNTVTHIMSGKAISRTLRAHFLVEKALLHLLVQDILPGGMEAEMGGRSLSHEQVLALETIALKARDSDIQETFIDEICDSQDLAMLDECLAQYKKVLSCKSRTAKYWIQYLYYIGIIEEFITSERTCFWEGHLSAVDKLLNLFAASGHVHYAKSARLYLQMMRDLPDQHPWLYEKFCNGHHAVRRSSRYWAGLWTDLCIEQILMRSMKARGGLTHGRGITESVRQQWVYSLHCCAAVHEAMSTLTCHQHTTSEQHVELGKTRCKRDSDDLQKIVEWFEDHNPFNVGIPSLRSLSTGITATEEDGVNCDEVEDIGHNIQLSLDGVSYSSAHIKRSDQVHTLESLQPGIKIGKKSIHVSPEVLFVRCTALAARESEDVAPYFKYELSAIPTSLFKDNFMRKADKSDLARELLKDLSSPIDELDDICRACAPVVDGGWLLHHVRWKKNVTYQEVVEQYELYLTKKYGRCSVVFDGYEGASTKDHEHFRRAVTKSADITVMHTSKCHKNQDAFLSNAHNKVQLIKLLIGLLRAKDHEAECSDSDADCLIVSTALKLAESDKTVFVVAQDTDILIMLIHHWRPEMADILMVKEKNSKIKGKCLELISIQKVYHAMNPVIRDNILFIHAWSGCDTTSSTFGQGKTHLFKLLAASPLLQDLVISFVDRNNSPEEVGTKGIAIFCNLYGGREDLSLNHLRYIRYQTMVARCSKIEPERLPPTERAAHYHSLRVYLQVIQWDKLDNKCCNALDWGWKIDKGVMHPIMTDLEAAPENVLKFIRCKCKVRGKKQCGTNQCSCFKAGLKCVSSCTGCYGEVCHNKSLVIEQSEVDEIEIEDIA